MNKLRDAAKVFRDAFPGDKHKDQSDDVPIYVMKATLGDWRALDRAIREAEGMVMVPKEPTEEMALAGMKAEAKPKLGDWKVSSIYRAMLAAAPSSEGDTK